MPGCPLLAIARSSHCLTVNQLFATAEQQGIQRADSGPVGASALAQRAPRPVQAGLPPWLHRGFFEHTGSLIRFTFDCACPRMRRQFTLRWASQPPVRGALGRRQQSPHRRLDCNSGQVPFKQPGAPVVTVLQSPQRGLSAVVDALGANSWGGQLAGRAAIRTTLAASLTG